MIDTLKLRSPYLTEPLAKEVESFLERRTCTDLSTGEIKWEFTKGGLDGTWDHRISVVVERFEFVNLPSKRPGGRSTPTRIACRPYLTVEGSVHKAMLGHNVFGGPVDVQASARWFIGELARRMQLQLPAADLWVYRRIDQAECFDLSSFDACSEYISYLHNAKFPRRKTMRYADEAIVIVGTTSTDKLYHKGPEFEKNDRLRLRRVLPDDLVKALQDRANMTLRAEVEIKAKTLDEWFTRPDFPAVASAKIGQHLQQLYNRDMDRFLREGASAVQIVRTAVAVKRRLYDSYSPAMARAAYSTWLELSSRGEKAAAECLSRKTFYRHRKALVESGCSWHDGDVKLDQRLRLVPEDFTPQVGDPRRVVGEDPIVAAALAPYRAAS